MAHLNLDDLQPEGHSFTFRGVEYKLPGVVPVPSVVRGVVLDEALAIAGERNDGEAIKAAAEELYMLVTDLMRDADPDVNLGGIYTDEQRAQFAAAVNAQAGAEVLAEDDITDDILELAGVEKTPGLRMTVPDLLAIMAMVGTGKAITRVVDDETLAQTISDAMADTLAEGEDVVTEEQGGRPGVPPTKPPSRAASVKRKSQNSSAKRSRSRSSA